MILNYVLRPGWLARAILIIGACQGFPTLASAQVGPAVPANPSPSDGAAGVSVTPVLRWSGFALTYDVYFGIAAAPPLLTTTPSPLFVPGTLAPDTLYYWKIVAHDGVGSTSSPVWTFHTPSSTALQLISVLPAEAVGSSGPSKLLAVGRNFAPGASVRWTTPLGDTTTLPAEFINSVQLQATIPASLFTTSGTAQVAIQNPDTTVAGSQPLVIRQAGPIYGASLTPDWGSGPNASLKLRISDAGGLVDLNRVLLHVSPSRGHFSAAPPNTCLVSYTLPSNLVGLANDTGGTDYLAPGASGILQNGQCAIDTSAVTVSTSGNNLLLALPLTFKNGFTGLMQMDVTADSNTYHSISRILGYWMPVPPAFVRRYTFTFAPTQFVPFLTTFAYTSISATPPGIESLPVAMSPRIVAPPIEPVLGSARNADGSWEFTATGLDPSLFYRFQAFTSLGFANTPGVYTGVPAQLADCARCSDRSSAGTVDITIADVPTPQLGSIQPGTAAALSPSFVLSASGSNLTPGAAVQWTAFGTNTTLPAAFIDSTQVQASIPGSLFTTPGTAHIAAVNPAGSPSTTLPFVVTNPTPTFTSITPSTAPQQSGPLQLTANGTDFYPNSTVRWTASGGTQVLPATFISGLQLQATIPASLLATPGTAQVSIQNSGSQPSESQLFTITAAPVWSITKTHSGSFLPGQTVGAQYTVTVANQGGAPSSGTVTVTETLPSALSLASMSGTGWNCAANVCTRADALNPGASYPPILVFVNVSVAAVSPQVNVVSVSGGDAATAGATDSTAITCVYQLSGATGYSSSASQGAVTIATATGCSWTASTATPWLHITSSATGIGSGQINYTLDANVAASQRVASISIAGQPFTIVQGAYLNPVGSGLRFVPVTPCRIADTRIGAGHYGGPSLAAATPRDFNIAGNVCGIPANAQAHSLNLTVVPITTLGFLSVWPAGQPQPTVSTLNSADGRIKANAAIVPAGTGGAITLFGSHATHVIVDINGYFVPAVGNNDLAFYPVTPCRIADTRGATGTLGAPALAPSAARSFPVPSSACGIPPTAQAYALNMTVVPSGSLGFLSAWPTGQAQPGSSTLNAPTGAVTANAAIVPAGTNGAITVIATHATNLIIDINGYFAPPGAGGMQFYAVTPCRISDTRIGIGPFGGPQLAASAQREIGVAASTCGIPATAGAYSLNATVIPPAALSFLTLWSSGGQPAVSTLNAGDGTIVANAALVPASATGSVTAIASNATHLILDINGYFSQ